MHTSLYSLLSFSHSVLGYELNWQEEAAVLAEVASDAAEGGEADGSAGH